MLAPPLERMSFRTFLEAFPSETACRDYMFFHVRKPWVAPSDSPCRWVPLRNSTRYCCAKCGAVEGAKTNTPYRASNLPVRSIFYGMLLIATMRKGVSVRFLGRQLGISHKAAHALASRMRKQISDIERPRTIGGPGKKVMIDETFLRLRGKERAIVLGMFDGQNLALNMVPNVRASTLLGAIESCVAPGSILITDGWGGYNRLNDRGWTHFALRHGHAPLKNYFGHTTAPIERIWRSLKQQIAGATGQISLDRLPLFIENFLFNFHYRNDIGFWRLVSTYPSVPVRCPVSSNPRC